ncbi:hypothetical protein SOVF_050050 [Spinacia oleracea]|nr:hypothetical protein SOVF_050050 [Spinacia oleracea]
MAAKLMNAIQYSRYGGGTTALKRVKIAVPDPKADEVLLKVEAVSLNAFDWKIQKGIPRPILPGKFPYVPGTDVAGEVVKVGSSATKFKAGDKVLALLSHATGGALAEYTVAKENMTVAKPPEVSVAEGAGLPLAALTAHTAVTHANIKLDGSGETKNVLITAASGGVGHYAVQIAKLGNTHVTATCGARNLEFVKGLGADEVLDYKTPEGASLRSPSGKKYEYVIHCAMDIPWATFALNLSETGKVIDLTPGLGTMIRFATQKLTFSKKQLVPLILSPKTENFEYVVNLAKEGKLKTVIDSKYPWSKAEDAWSRIISGHAMGKVIIEF